MTWTFRRAPLCLDRKPRAFGFWILVTLTLCALSLGARHSAQAQNEPRPPVSAATARASGVQVSAVLRIELTVGDIQRSLRFFEALGFTRETPSAEPALSRDIFGQTWRSIDLRLGAEEIRLLASVGRTGRPMPADTQGNDHWFQHIAIVVSDMDAAYTWLRKLRVAHVSSSPQTLPTWNPAAAGVQAFYFADPDGHTLELIHFPKGKGDAKWQQPIRCQNPVNAHCLFLGIDHTAITVEDTDASLRFYRDTLGLRVAGESENYGVEQEHLNGVFGAHLRITALRAAAGPGIELLEYLAPRGGRVMPKDVSPRDLFHWQIVVQSRGQAMLAAKALGDSQVIAQDRSRAHALVRDRDGHALLLAP